MDQILNNPGLQHLAENVFWNLDVEVLKICAQINQTTKQIMEDSFFWLKKFRGLSNEDQNDWSIYIQLMKDAGKEKAFISYMKWQLKIKFEMPKTCHCFHCCCGSRANKCLLCGFIATTRTWYYLPKGHSCVRIRVVMSQLDTGKPWCLITLWNIVSSKLI